MNPDEAVAYGAGVQVCALTSLSVVGWASGCMRYEALTLHPLSAWGRGRACLPARPFWHNTHTCSYKLQRRLLRLRAWLCDTIALTSCVGEHSQQGDASGAWHQQKGGAGLGGRHPVVARHQSHGRHHERDCASKQVDLFASVPIIFLGSGLCVGVDVCI